MDAIATESSLAHHGPMRFAPDTNFFLQFKKAQELPWQDLTDADRIELLVLNEVLEELDKHKNGGNARLNRRSRDTLQELRPLILGQQDELVARDSGPRVVLKLAPILPPTRRHLDALDLTKADARIVNEALAFHSDVGEVMLLTHDSLPLRLARTVGLKAQFLPDDWRLPPETDSKDKEIAKLQLELGELRKRAPQVLVQVIVDDEPTNHIIGTLKRYAPPSPALLRLALDAICLRHPNQSVSNIGSIQVYRQADVDIYERKREEWSTCLLDQMERYASVLNFSQGLFPLALKLTNTGTASAEGFVVEVFAEGNVRLVDLDEHESIEEKRKFNLRKAPKLSLYSDFLGAQMHELPAGMLASNFHAIRDPQYRFRSITSAVSRKFSWEFDKPEVSATRVEGSCGDFRHRIHAETLSFALRVPSSSSEEPVGRLRVRYSAKNLSEPQECVWPVRLVYEWGDTAAALTSILKEQLDVEFVG